MYLAIILGLLLGVLVMATLSYLGAFRKQRGLGTILKLLVTSLLIIAAALFTGRAIMASGALPFLMAALWKGPAIYRSYLWIKAMRQMHQQMHGSQGRQQSANSAPPQMDKATALQVLGLDASYTKEQVDQQYKHYLKRLHPDVGGNDYLTQMLNQAREILLKE